MSSIYRKPERSYRRELERGSGRRRRKSRSAGQESRFGQSSTRPILPQWIRRGALMVLLLGFAGLLLFLIRPGKTTAVAASTLKDPSTPGSASILPQEEPTTGTWQGLRPIQVARAFTAATTHPERLKWVDQPEEVATLMEEFYTRGPGHTETITALSAMRIPMQDGRAFDSFQVTLADGSLRLLDVAYELDGHAKVDFKSYSRYCSTPWSALLDGSCPTAAEMRVSLQADAYYNRGFSDEGAWLCLIATSPDLKEPLYLYVRRDNPQMRDFLRDLPDREMRYTVSIQNTADGWQHRQFILSKVLRSGWLGH
jgi:hypothetical protein